MNSTSLEIRRLNKSRFLIDVVFVVVTVAAEAFFLLFEQRASAGLHFRPSVCLVTYLVFGGLFAVFHLSKHFSAVHSIVIV